MGKTTKKNMDPVWQRIQSLNTGRRGEQTELMEFCGLAQNTYNAWRSGDLKSYTKHIDKIAAFYEVSTDWILTGKERTGIMKLQNNLPMAGFDLERIERAANQMAGDDGDNPLYVISQWPDRLIDEVNLAVQNPTRKENKKRDELDELADYLEMLRTRPEVRMLFSLSKDATKEDVEKAVAIIEVLREKEK